MKMKDGDDANGEPQDALEELRQRVVELEAARADLNKAKELLRAQNEFITNALECLTHPFYVIDVNDYTIKIANSAARAELGILTENSTCHSVTHRTETPCNDLDGHPCPIETVKQTGQPVKVEHVHYDREGNARDIEVHGYPITNNDGEIVQMIEYCLDITERKRAEEELRSLKEFNENVVQSIQDGLIVFDRDFRITFWNKAMERLLGYTAQEVLGKFAYEFLPHIQEPGMEELLESVLEGQIASGSNIPFQTPKGMAGFTNEQYMPLQNQEGDVIGVLALVEDVTGILQLEQRVAILQEELKQRKFIDMAKDILVREEGLSLTESNRFILQKSQEQRIKAVEVAKRVVLLLGTPEERKEIL